MKKLNAKGFTLIELLAVVTIMGILMLVAIPAVGRAIENTRRDSFLDTAKQYVNGVKTLWVSDSLECGGTPSTALTTGTYYVQIDSAQIAGGSGIGPGTTYPIILESGGKSSWSGLHVKGFVAVTVTTTNGVTNQSYGVRLTDGKHGVVDFKTIEYMDLKRGNVLTAIPASTPPCGTGVKLDAISTPNDAKAGSSCKVASPVFCKEV